jgi:virginiamycin A acetyltransferase
MANFHDYGSWARVQTDALFIQFLGDSRICSSVRSGEPSRWNDKTFICFQKTTEMEPYSAVYMGEPMYPMGGFSAVNTPFQPHNYGLRISFGRYCSIGGGAKIAGPAHPMTTITTAPPFYDGTLNMVKSYFTDEGITDFPWVDRPALKGPPSIGNDVWFGENVFLNTGINIGNGAVVAANSVVTKDVSDYTIVGGNPARLIRQRFPSEIVTELQKIKLWSYAPKDLSQFNMTNIEAFIREFYDARHQIQEWKPKTAHLWNSYKQLHRI